MTHLEDRLHRFWDFCQQRRLDRAALKVVPYIGPSIEEIVYGGEIEDLIGKIRHETSQHQQEVADALEAIMRDRLEPPAYILVIGSGNAEHVFNLDRGFRLETEIAARRFDLGKALRDVARLQRQKLLYRRAAQQSFENGDEVEELFGTVIAEIVNAMGDAIRPLCRRAVMRRHRAGAPIFALRG